MNNTQGEWEELRYIQDKKFVIWNNQNFNIAWLPYLEETESEQEANAQLIAEAGTVANETGFTPRQLAEQNQNLKEACLMAREELVFGGDWNTAKKIINEALKPTNS